MRISGIDNGWMDGYYYYYIIAILYNAYIFLLMVKSSIAQHCPLVVKVRHHTTGRRLAESASHAKTKVMMTQLV